MMGGHPNIHTASEPWLMLPPIYALRSEGVEAEYNAQWARGAITSFLEGLPDGREEYIQGLRRMYQGLYNHALQDTRSSIFVDKTPRYYLILPELRRVFPEAKFILLVRHPLAVLSSMLDTWVGDAWLTLARFRIDLLEAPGLLLRGRTDLGDKASYVRYEDLVGSPFEEMRRLCRHVGVEFYPGMVRYGESEKSQFAYGDQQTVYERSKPTPEFAEAWKHRAERPQHWKLLSDYARELGPECFKALGYNYADSLRILDEKRPSAAARGLIFSLSQLTERPPQDRSRWMHRLVRAAHHVRQTGVWGLAKYVARGLNLSS